MTEAVPTPIGDFRLGEWLIQPSLNRISRGDSTVSVELKMMAVLVCLAEHPGELVTRQDLIDTVWAIEYISEKTLTRAIAELRRALGDDARKPSYIETIHRRGYRLLATPSPVSDEESSASRTLSHYLLLEHLGGGGMGVVYRAEDTKLRREVALKFLSKALTHDPDARKRFMREARAASALDHLHICTIHEIDETPDGQLFIVMAYYEGETLQKKIDRGPLPVDEAVRIGREIAEGLELAHEAGIIHRDIKPANVMITSDGVAKIVDFGLAKLRTQTQELESEAQTGTLETSAGKVVGTVAYMSPEQAAGRVVDKRTDIWAFGCVVYEMLAGVRPFSGTTTTETLAAIIRDDPDWDVLPSETPTAIRRLLRRCLNKNPRDRIHDIADARIEIGDVLSGEAGEEVGGESGGAETGPRRQRWTLIASAAAMIAAAATAGYFLGHERPTEQRVVKLSLPAPAGTTYHLNYRNPGPVVVSPDGSTLLFSARDASKVFTTGNLFDQVRLYLRPLDAEEARALAGTEGAQYPFWSPDSRSIGFFADGKVKKIDAGGGPSITLCDAPNGTGGTWGPSGDIIFAPAPTGPIHRVSDSGGEPTPVTTLDTDRGDYSHRHPRILPGGRQFLYLALTNDRDRQSQHTVVVAPLADGPETVLLRSPAAADYASGQLLFLRETTLMARPFDSNRMEFRGEAVPVCEDVLVIPGAAIAIFSASSSGVLACQSSDGGVGSRLTWFDRNGRKKGTLGEPADYNEVFLSPDGTKAAVGIYSPSSKEEALSANQTDIWIYDIDRQVASRLTFHPSVEDQIAWSPDSGSIAFARRLPEGPNIYRKSIGDTGAAEPLLESELYALPTSWSWIGELLAFDSLSPDTGWDQWILPLGGGEPFPFLQSPFNEADGVFSPDGRWMAYESDESGRWEIYVTSFPGPGRRRRVSMQGGISPTWNSSGRELFYRSETGDVMGVAVNLDEDPVEIGTPEPLIEGQLTKIANLDYKYSPAPGGERFLLIPDQRGTQPLNIIFDWTTILAR